MNPPASTGHERLKVVYFIDGLGRGGAQRHLVSLLKNLDRSRFEPHLWCLNKSGDLVSEVEQLGIPLFDMSFDGEKIFGFRAVHTLPSCWTRLRRLKPHIVHTYLFSPNVYGTFLSALARVPIVLSSRRDLAWWETRRHLLATRLSNLFVDRVVAVSEPVRQHAISRERLAPETVVTVPNGIELPDFDNAFKKAVNLPAIDRSGPIVAMTAGLRPVKRHEDLFEALRQVKSSYPRLRCLLIGDGPRRVELETLARDLGLEDTVAFLGWQANIAAILKRVDIFALCSESEGFSNAVLEAMAASCPVIATEVGGNREAVSNGDTGLLIPSKNPDRIAEALLLLLRDPQKASAMGASGRQRVERLFTAATMARRVEALYMELARCALGHAAAAPMRSFESETPH